MSEPTIAVKFLSGCHPLRDPSIGADGVMGIPKAASVTITITLNDPPLDWIDQHHAELMAVIQRYFDEARRRGSRYSNG